MNKCRDCNRLIASDETHHLCDVCYAQYELEIGLVEDAIKIHGYERPIIIAAHTHLSPERVEHLIEDARIAAYGAHSEDPCSNCHVKKALFNSTYCLHCQLAIYNSLGDEAHLATLNQSNHYAQPDTSLTSLRATLDEKRQRTGGKRFRTPPQSVKGR
jgi:hypothetical protein